MRISTGINQLPKSSHQRRSRPAYACQLPFEMTASDAPAMASWLNICETLCKNTIVLKGAGSGGTTMVAPGGIGLLFRKENIPPEAGLAVPSGKTTNVSLDSAASFGPPANFR